jgi:hypothetical protein
MSQLLSRAEQRVIRTDKSNSSLSLIIIWLSSRWSEDRLEWRHAEASMISPMAALMPKLDDAAAAAAVADAAVDSPAYGGHQSRRRPVTCTARRVMICDVRCLQPLQSTQPAAVHRRRRTRFYPRVRRRIARWRDCRVAGFSELLSHWTSLHSAPSQRSWYRRRLRRRPMY